MPMSCCISGCCCHKRRPTKTKTKYSICLKQALHKSCILCGQIIASAILISLTLWLLLRQIEPSAYVNNFELDAIKYSNTTMPLLHFNVTVHNPDIYKSIIYDSLALRIFYRGWNYMSSGITVNFDAGFVQGPGRSDVLSNHTADMLTYNWEDYLPDIKAGTYPFRLKLLMLIRYKFLNKVIGTRQIMKVADVYFNEEGEPFIDPRGLLFK